MFQPRLPRRSSGFRLSDPVQPAALSGGSSGPLAPGALMRRDASPGECGSGLKQRRPLLLRLPAKRPPPTARLAAAHVTSGNSRVGEGGGRGRRCSQRGGAVVVVVVPALARGRSRYHARRYRAQPIAANSNHCPHLSSTAPLLPIFLLFSYSGNGYYSLYLVNSSGLHLWSPMQAKEILFPPTQQCLHCQLLSPIGPFNLFHIKKNASQ